MTLLDLGCILIISALCYAVWIQLRVARLRQDIFDKRDALFDLARAHQALDDPAYRDMRNRLNGTAALADALSVPVILQLIGSAEKPERVTSTNQELQTQIDRLYVWMATRILRYLAFETLTGLLLSAFVFCFRLTNSQKQATIDIASSSIKSSVLEGFAAQH